MGLDGAHIAAREALWPAVMAVALAGRLERGDLAAHEGRSDASCGVMNGVALGHSLHRTKHARLTLGRRLVRKGRDLRRTLILSLIAFSALAAPAFAEKSSSWVELGPQWVVINACDSGSHTVGVRASQAGDELGRRMFTRFSLQWFSQQRNAWLSAGGSPWLDAGPGPWLARETGWNQAFQAPPAGHGFRIRGVVEMQWRAGGAVQRSQTLVTPQVCLLR